MLLRKLTHSDVTPMIEIANYSIKNATKAQTLELIDKANTQFESGEGISWGMELDGKIIGSIGYYRGFANETGEIGYVMCEAFKRKGYMAEAATAVMNVGWNKLKLKRITAYTEIDNLASVLLLEKLGFRNTNQTFKHYTIFEMLRKDASKKDESSPV